MAEREIGNFSHAVNKRLGEVIHVREFVFVSHSKDGVHTFIITVVAKSFWEAHKIFTDNADKLVQEATN